MLELQGGIGRSYWASLICQDLGQCFPSCWISQPSLTILGAKNAFMFRNNSKVTEIINKEDTLVPLQYTQALGPGLLKLGWTPSPLLTLFKRCRFLSLCIHNNLIAWIYKWTWSLQSLKEKGFLYEPSVETLDLVQPLLLQSWHMRLRGRRLSQNKPHLWPGYLILKLAHISPSLCSLLLCLVHSLPSNLLWSLLLSAWLPSWKVVSSVASSFACLCFTIPSTKNHVWLIVGAQ